MTALCAAGCVDARIAAVRRYNELVDGGQMASARSLVAPGARVWYESPVGEGNPWTPGEGSWSGWDRHFNSSKRIVGDYQRDDEAVWAVFDETNGYYRLTERQWSRTMLTWYVDDRGLITGLFVAGVGEPVSRAAEFRTWAKANAPDEYAYLFPDDRIDPTGDRPERMHALLLKWRASTGLPPLAE
ncbi:MAG: hypothetical protein FLDDKLPJ_02812 [Phycisphaerae bacterium]|nr:hypothetical protein [Phycisphaerae bacterium]